jgi:ferredoxin
MYCGLCSEACPTGAIRHTREFEGANAQVANLVMRFVRPGDEHQTYKAPKDKSEIESRPVGEALREARKAWNAPSGLSAVEQRGQTTYEPFDPPDDLAQLPRLGPVADSEPKKKPKKKAAAKKAGAAKEAAGAEAKKDKGAEAEHKEDAGAKEAAGGEAKPEGEADGASGDRIPTAAEAMAGKKMPQAPVLDLGQPAGDDKKES